MVGIPGLAVGSGPVQTSDRSKYNILIKDDFFEEAYCGMGKYQACSARQRAA